MSPRPDQTPPSPPLSRRERQIMDILYARGPSTVAEILAHLHDPPSYSSVRALLRILETKHHARHKKSANKYLYEPITPRKQAAKSALSRLLHTFFSGSIENAVATHLADPSTRLSPEQLRRLLAMIEQARQREEGP